MMMGRSNTDVFFAGFGTWILGGALFFGDVRAGAQALAHQVLSRLKKDFKKIQIQNKIFKKHKEKKERKKLSFVLIKFYYCVNRDFKLL